MRRNLLGLKPIALLVLIGAMLVNASALWLGIATPAHAADMLADASVRWPLYVAMTANLACVAIWLLIIRPNFVQQSADEYAAALFRTLDE
jgi:hypothetical protein